MTPDPPYLDGLNPPQRDAVLTTEGPVLVLAGAGTGKTAALTARLAHLIATRLAWPSQILAVTFTNKAAREMKERVSAISGGAIEGMPWLGTFHSVAARMLRSRPLIYMIPETMTNWSVVRIGRSASGMGCAPIAAQIALVDLTSISAILLCASRSPPIRTISTRASLGSSLASVPRRVLLNEWTPSRLA
jgi:hypothetical protein